MGRLNLMSMSKINLRDNLANLFVFAYIFYGKCLIYIGYQQGRLSLILLIAALVFCFFADGMKLKISRCLTYEFVFIAITIFSSLLIATNKAASIDVMETFFDSLFLGYVIIRSVLRSGKVNIILYAWIASAVVLTTAIIFTGGTVIAGGRVTISEELNVNTLGIFMTFAVWAVLYFISNTRISIVNAIVSICLIAAFLYVIILTASKKSIVITVLLIAVWGLWCFRPILKRMSITQKLLITLGFAIVVFFIVREFSIFFNEASVLLLNRLENVKGSTVQRTALIRDALLVFLKNPGLGVGWNNYKYYSIYGMYSHCTYVEILACTGMIGAVLGTVMSVVSLKGLFLYIKFNKYSANLGLKNVWMVVLLIVLLIDGATQIIFYNANLLIIVHLLFAYSELQMKKSRERLV